MAGKKQKTVLVAVLDWGLGHASRCVPIIRFLQQQGHSVQLASSGAAASYLHHHFPELSCHSLPAYAPEYSRDGQMMWAMMKQIPRFMRVIAAEEKVIGQLIEKTRADLLISDNRYGAFSRIIPSLFITHQVNIQPPPGLSFLGPLINQINHRLINRFTACGVPDFPPPHNVAGELSIASTLRIPVHYLGTLSALEPYASPGPTGNYWLAVLSGPEPQRSMLEQNVRQWLDKQDSPSIIVRGLAGQTGQQIVGRRTEYDFAGGEKLAELIRGAKGVICRSGYSTLMDLIPFAKRVMLIPTPGQTEQEYLAKRMLQQGKALVVKQQELPEFQLPPQWPVMSFSRQEKPDREQWINTYL